MGINQKNRTFFDFIKPKIHVLAPLGPFTDQMTDFPTLLYTSTNEIPTLSYTLSLKKILLLGKRSRSV